MVGESSGSRTEAKTENKNNTTASVGEVQIDVVAFDLLAEHKLDYNSLAGIDLDISVLGRSGAAEAYNNVNTTVLAKVGKNAKITANDILIRANNYTSKEWLSDDQHNAYSGSGSAIDLATAKSETFITQKSLIEILDEAILRLLSDPFYPGDINLAAYNEIRQGWGEADQWRRNYFSSSESRIEATVDTEVSVECNLDSAEDIAFRLIPELNWILDAMDSYGELSILGISYSM